jgi:hypothetical protein
VGDVAEMVLPTVEARLDQSLAEPVDLLLATADTAPAECTPRAAAIPARRRIVLFAGPAALEPGALEAFLAHELGHQLTYDRWRTLGSDRRLTEGIATWAAAPYWLSWRRWDSLDGAVVDLLGAGALAPLEEQGPDCLLAAQRDVYYSAWASFVGFLIHQYGWDRFSAALALPEAGPRLADYQGTYGRTLAELAREWQASLLE